VLVAAPGRAKQDAADARRNQRRAEIVDLYLVAFVLHLEHSRGDEDGQGAERHVDVEHPAPAQLVDENAAQQRPHDA
jgi:hypothetical protein